MKLIISTSPAEDAGRIAGVLLEERLVACVNAVPGVRSRYWWKGALEEADEVILLMKTTDALADRAIRKLAEVHPYEVPEAVALDIAGGWAPYLDWIGQVTREP